MSSSGDHEKAEEVVHELFGATCLIGKLLSLRVEFFSESSPSEVRERGAPRSAGCRARESNMNDWVVNHTSPDIETMVEARHIYTVAYRIPLATSL